jgi:hypothetical protein
VTFHENLNTLQKKSYGKAIKKRILKMKHKEEEVKAIFILFS